MVASSDSVAEIWNNVEIFMTTTCSQTQQAILLSHGIMHGPLRVSQYHAEGCLRDIMSELTSVVSPGERFSIPLKVNSHLESNQFGDEKLGTPKKLRHLSTPNW